MFGRMWNEITQWEVKLYDKSGDSYIVGFSFKSRNDAKVVLSKQPWFFNGDLLLLEEWPNTEQWKYYRLGKIPIGNAVESVYAMECYAFRRDGRKVKGLKWSNDRLMFLNSYVRLRIGFPLHKSTFVGRFIPSDGKQHWV
ncbi:hypothetical protein F8388_019975 [Cannabis sativa]|uniref:DUF4283 domain-containing protein n=1 Tax=Cannabis sativa TaxID=3483 RepID=A0A7J6GUD4_CANSA|nr:hypothetical protein F8388_019975 [Cannabis sativa]